METDATTAAAAARDATSVVSDFGEVVASLKSAYVPEAISAAASSVMGKLKIMQKAVVALDATPTIKGMQLASDMAELALLYLPKDTKDALIANNCSSDMALELATPEELDADEGLKALHSQLASPLELYGALVAHGVNPHRRPWAKKLLDQYSSLSELRWLSWRRLMHELNMDFALGLESAATDIPDNEKAPDAGGGEEGAEGVAAEEKAANTALLAATPPLPPVVRTPLALSKGEVAVLSALYSVGTDVPPIRKQALDFGLGLDVAGQLEDAGVLTSSTLTESKITYFQSKLEVPGKTEAEVKSALMAMMSNKVGALQDEDDAPLFGSYGTNEELVAAAGGGMALYGINFFPTENDVTLKPYAPVLKKPTFVEMAGASASFEASVLHCTEQSMASNFTKTTENGGISIAQSSSTSWGVSASVSSYGGVAGASASADSGAAEEATGESKGQNAFSANSKSTTKSATTVESITCPMKSFRIPVSTMTMTDEALDSATKVDTLLKAGQFFDTFGSHVSNGRHLLGGIFFRTMTMTTETEVETSTLLAAASTQMQQTRTESAGANVSASAAVVGASAAASATMKSASSSGVVKFHTTAGHTESESEDARAMYHTYVRSMGPNVATPELFAEALFTDTSSWTVIDRGPFEALLPITTVLENMVAKFDHASPTKAKLENAMNLMTVAWQQRAAAWKHLEDDPAVPTSLRHMIGRSFAVEDTHDQIRAAVVDLFEVLESEAEGDLEKAANALSNAVIATAKEMETKPPGQADFFPELKAKIDAMPDITGKYDFKTNTSEYHSAARSAKKLSTTDWSGFDLIWKKQLGQVALRDALHNHIKFEEATLRLGESITPDEPLVSVGGKYRLEISGKALRVVDTTTRAVSATLFEAEGTLGKGASAHMEEDGSFVLDLTMITGFDRTETRMVLWTAPNTESGRGGYARMQNNGTFSVFNRKGQVQWSTSP